MSNFNDSSNELDSQLTEENKNDTVEQNSPAGEQSDDVESHLGSNTDPETLSQSANNDGDEALPVHSNHQQLPETKLSDDTEVSADLNTPNETPSTAHKIEHFEQFEDLTLQEAIEAEISDELKAKIIEQANKVLEGEHIHHSDPQTSPAGDSHHALAKPELTYPQNLLLLPVKERPFFPGQQLPVLISKSAWESTFDSLENTQGKYLGLVFVEREDHETTPAEDFSPVGTLVKISNLKKRDDYIQMVAEGVCRFKIEHWLQGKAPYKAVVSYPKDDITGSEDELKAYGMAIMNAFRELLPLNPLYSEELKYFLSRYSTSEPSHLADFAAGLTTADNEKLQDVLETFDLVHRLEKVLALFKHEIEVTQLQFNIRERVEENLSEHQRDFFLRQQLKEIQKELGIVKDDQTLDKDRFEERMEKLALTDEAMLKAEEELHKLSILDPQSPEYNVTRNWLDWLTQLPWGQISEDKLKLKRAKKILDKKHDGLTDVKNRILEFIAVGALKGEVAGSIICLVGPPGVGKTSIGKSIAQALGRKFYRFSVGGMRDEAEIKGHRRTYIGAMPGKFIQALKDCQTANPVIMLDEIDKIHSSYHGDPAAALLEVLDPEQNHDFMDHFMDVRFDLSKALFVCTANTLDTIPAPLLDRMEIIRLSGYITEEKIQIAKHHLWPELLKESGLSAKQVQISTPAIRHIIEGYAREAGVRNLKKQLAKVLRKLALQFAQKEINSFKIQVRELEQLLGQPRFAPEKQNHQIGTVTGLAWTSMGGATLGIEASRIHTLNRGFKLSGQLGEVMQESAGIAYSYIGSNLQQYKADPEFFDKAFVHLHVPDGATPKDGPSAGITMATALLSLARGEAIKTPLAMTGELSLTGQVLAVGGIREKVIAARRLGLQQLILPNDNKKDYQELPNYLKEGLTVHFAKHFQDVAKLTFEIKKPSPALQASQQ